MTPTDTAAILANHRAQAAHLQRTVLRRAHWRCGGTGWIDNTLTGSTEPCTCDRGFEEVQVPVAPTKEQKNERR